LCELAFVAIRAKTNAGVLRLRLKDDNEKLATAKTAFFVVRMSIGGGWDAEREGHVL
jgi:hypothetical protein